MTGHRNHAEILAELLAKLPPDEQAAYAEGCARLKAMDELSALLARADRRVIEDCIPFAKRRALFYAAEAEREEALRVNRWPRGTSEDRG